VAPNPDPNHPAPNTSPPLNPNLKIKPKRIIPSQSPIPIKAKHPRL
jgi:hypothetical protein